ncbi:MAG: ZIP family metal transporter [Aquimonas sp.]|nr:ZIP family metal transporter [Aquimonas sp.]
MSAGLQGIEWVAASLTACSVIVAASLIGPALVRGHADRRQRVIPPLLALAMGVLIGDALIHLLPHAWREFGGPQTVTLCAAGFLLFGGISRWLSQRHENEGRRLASLSIGGDALHNLADGALIALAFAASPQLGLVTTLAVLAHELPQELGDYAILLQSGLSPRKALLANLASASTIFIGASSGLLLGHVIEGFVALLTPIIAGSFLYLAGFILLPALRQHVVRHGDFARSRLLPLALGVSTMGALALTESWLDLEPAHTHDHPHPAQAEDETAAPNFSPLGSKRAD